MKWQTVLKRLYQEKRIVVFTRSEKKNVQLQTEMKTGYRKITNEMVWPVYVTQKCIKWPELWEGKERKKCSTCINVILLLIFTFYSKGSNTGNRFEVFRIVKLLHFITYLVPSVNSYIIVFRIATKTFSITDTITTVTADFAGKVTERWTPTKGVSHYWKVLTPKISTDHRPHRICPRSDMLLYKTPHTRA